MSERNSSSTSLPHIHTLTQYNAHERRYLGIYLLIGFVHHVYILLENIHIDLRTCLMPIYLALNIVIKARKNQLIQFLVKLFIYYNFCYGIRHIFVECLNVLKTNSYYIVIFNEMKCVS